MTAHKGALMFLVGTATSALVGVILVTLTGGVVLPWLSAAATSAGWLAAIVVSGDSRWGPTAAASGVANIWTLFLMSSKGITPVTVTLALVAVGASVLHVVRQQQPRRS